MWRQPGLLLNNEVDFLTEWKPDLHLHTTASDGVLAPQDVVFRAKGQGINLIAVTDHDTLRGLDEAARAAEQAGIRFIPGIEISTQGEEEIHLLGYNVRTGLTQLDAMLDAIRADRMQREPRFLQRLTELDMPIAHEDLQIPEGAMFSRPLLARAMVRRGYVDSAQQAFDQYIGVGCPAYIPRLNIPTTYAVSVLKNMGAIPVLAHPGLIRKLSEEMGRFLEACIDAGLMGIEAYHPTHTHVECDYWADYSREKGLIVTGGSDFHDLPDHLHGEIGQMLALWNDAEQDANMLLSMVTS